MKVTQQVLARPACLVFERAENRIHCIGAVLVATLES